MNKHFGITIFTLFACFMWSTSCSPFVTVISTPTVRKLTATLAVSETLPPTATRTVIPTETQTPTPKPTEVLPTPTPEFAADNFVELIDQKVAEIGGMVALEQKLEQSEKYDLFDWRESGAGWGYVPPIGYYGFRELEQFWGVSSHWLNLGAERLSLINVPGARKGDFALIMLGARPLTLLILF